MLHGCLISKRFLSIVMNIVHWTMRQTDPNSNRNTNSGHSCFVNPFLQGLSERLAKVICLLRSQFSHKLSFLSCFRSRISDKFIPFSIQIHHDQPKASKKVCASNVLSGPGRLLQANHWLWDSGQRSKLGVSVCEGQHYRCEQRWICSNC